MQFFHLFVVKCLQNFIIFENTCTILVGPRGISLCWFDLMHVFGQLGEQGKPGNRGSDGRQGGQIYLFTTYTQL